VTLEPLARALRSVIPDPFVIAIFLTITALGVGIAHGMAAGDLDVMALVDAWVSGYVPPDAPPGTKALGGLWSLLPFAMQMCLILVTGFVVASTRPVRWLIDRLAAIPTGTRSAIVVIGCAAMALALVNWGLGLIGGALLAREVGRALKARGVAVHYPLLAAAGYLGLAVWHGGLSGSAPLKVTSRDGLNDVLGGVLGGQIDVMSLSDTIFSLRNLVVTPLAGIAMLGVLLLLVPSDPARFRQAPDVRDDRSNADDDAAPGAAGWLERTPWANLALAALMLAWIVPWLVRGGLMGLTPDSMNLLFLALGLVLAGGPAAYMRHAAEGARACAGIIIQFPLYGGILGLLVAGGVVGVLQGMLPTSGSGLSLATFLSAGLLNLFVPSGGGQWALQGPLVMQVAAEHGIEPGRVVLALAWGDQWTNLFQPFWALPLLGITGTRAGDLLGPTLLAGVAAGIVFALGAAIG